MLFVNIPTSAQYNIKILFGQNGQPKSVLVGNFQIWSVILKFECFDDEEMRETHSWAEEITNSMQALFAIIVVLKVHDTNKL